MFYYISAILPYSNKFILVCKEAGSVIEGDQCVPCPANSYAGAGNTTCTDCPTNSTTANVTGATSIDACSE